MARFDPACTLWKLTTQQEMGLQAYNQVHSIGN